MPRDTSPRCLQCAKLSTKDAQEKECWQSGCKQIRYYHQNRDAINHDRRIKRLQKKLEAMPRSAELHEVGEVHAIAPIMIYYRPHKEAQVHAISAELRVDGERFTRLRPIHCLGMTASKRKAWQLRALQDLSEIYGKNVGKFRGELEIDPSQCPLCQCYEQSKNNPEKACNSES